MLLSANDTLQKLLLNGNPIGDKGAAAIASLLSKNYTIVKIHLEKCYIHSGGAGWIAAALCGNCSLQHLDLSQNLIGVEGAALFAEMLHQNKSLKTLHLSDYSIREEGIQMLIDSLIGNTTLEKLGLPYEFRQEYVTDKRVRYIYSDLDTHEGRQIFPAIIDAWCITLFISFVDLVISLLTAYMDYNLLYTVVGIIIVNLLIIWTLFL